MKIAAPPPPLAIAGASLQPLLARQPFAELLENGCSAEAVVSARALSFSETGILGLHFAGDTSAACAAEAPAPEAAAVTAATSTGTPGSLPITPSIPQKADAPDTRSDARPLEVRAGGVGVTSPAMTQMEAPTDSRRTWASQASASSEPEGEAASSANRLARLAQSLASTGSGLPHVRVRLRSEDSGVAIELHGFALSEEDRVGFESIGRSVAAQFGVAVSRLLVTDTNGPGKASPPGGASSWQ